MASTASLPADLLRTAYLIDTGTQISLVCTLTNLLNVTELSDPVAWSGASTGSPQTATHVGQLVVNLRGKNDKTHRIVIPGVYYSPSARLNAISTSDLLAANVSFTLNTESTDDSCVIFGPADDRKSIKVRWIESLPFLPTKDLRPPSPEHNPISTRTITATMMNMNPSDYAHLIFDHSPAPVLKRLAERTVGLLAQNQTFSRMTGPCHICMETRGRVSNHNEEGLPEVVHASDDLWCMDLLDLPRATSLDGNNHCLLIIDAWSSYRVSLFSPSKDGLINQLALYLTWHKNYTGRSPKFFQTDGAGELCGPPMRALHRKFGISPRVSPAYDARPTDERRNRWTWQASTFDQHCITLDSPTSSGLTQLRTGPKSGTESQS
jgi:hypothetical protein